MAQITGSRAYERFAGPQIVKIIQEKPDVYSNTERISLVSSFLASLFIGDYAPIDWSDGSGMNLFNIHTKTWENDLLKACAPDLKEKLGDPVPSSTIVGFISEYFVNRYSFNNNCKVIAFTGDNPSSLVGMGLKKNDVACSLGTSDTLFLWLNEPKVVENGHILCNPLDNQRYMALLGFRNGSLTRERIRNTYAHGCWTIFNQLLQRTNPGNKEYRALYLDVQEIFPPLNGDFIFKKTKLIKKFSSEWINVRAVIEGQFVTRRLLAEDFGFSIGGASVNRSILQVLANVFNSSVYVSNTINAAVLGSACRAKFGILKDNTYEARENLFEKLPPLVRICDPEQNTKHVYDEMVKEFRQIIQQLLRQRRK